MFVSPWFDGKPAKFKGLFTFDNPFELCLENDTEIYTLFKDGKWAEIAETITKEEAEKQLGKKII